MSLLSRTIEAETKYYVQLVRKAGRSIAIAPHLGRQSNNIILFRIRRGEFLEV